MRSNVHPKTIARPETIERTNSEPSKDDAPEINFWTLFVECPHLLIVKKTGLTAQLFEIIFLYSLNIFFLRQCPGCFDD